MQINNLQPYYWDGLKLEPYSNDKIFIKNKNYKINNGPFYKIENIKQVRYIDGQQLTDKYIYKIRNENNNNKEIYIKLTFMQMLIFYFSTKFLFDILNFIKYSLSFILWLICSIFNLSFSQERNIINNTIEFNVISELKIPQKSHWNNIGVINEDFGNEWKNSNGYISHIFLAIPKDFPDYRIIIIPNIIGIAPEGVNAHIYDYDKISIHAHPAKPMFGYSWYLIPKSELIPTSSNVKVFSSIFYKTNIYYCGYSGLDLRIDRSNFQKSLNYWKYYYSPKNQRELKRNSYKYGEKYHNRDYRSFNEYFSIVSYKDIVRFNCKSFGGNNIPEDVYLESSYYEIPKFMWESFISAPENNNLKLPNKNKLQEMYNLYLFNRTKSNK